MSIGSVLVGVAAALVVGAFVARPFRRAQVDNAERAIERWVAQARLERREEVDEVKERGSKVSREQESRGTKGARSWEADEIVAFCPQCGRRVGPEDRFCARCGRPLREE